MFTTIKIFLLIFAFFYKNAFCGELSFATEGLFCQVGVHICCSFIYCCSKSGEKCKHIQTIQKVI